MALDSPVDDSRVHTANVIVSTVTHGVSKYITDVIFMFRENWAFCLRVCQKYTRQQRSMCLMSERRGRQQSLTPAAPNELKLGEGGK